MYDIIGDIHGCFTELVRLTKKLGYDWTSGVPQHPDGRLPVFLGDLTDRGPNSLSVVDTVCQLVERQRALYVPGNHCDKLYRYFIGRNVQIQNGLETTVAEYEALDDRLQKHLRQNFIRLYESAPLYLRLDHDNLIVAHAGLREDMIGRGGRRVKTFVLYGDITGEKLPDGRPLRRDWARLYQGRRWIVYGHTPVLRPRRINRTINIDTGCVFGGALTAFCWPEKETVSVSSTLPYCKEKFHTFSSDDPANET